MIDRSELDERIVASHRSVAKALDRLMLPRLIELGISMPQFKALIAVSCASPDGISVTELGNGLSIGQPSASLIVDQLERLGFCERSHDTTDRRRVLVRVTELGSEVASELRMGRRLHLHSWLAEIADHDAVALEQGLSALAEVIELSSLDLTLVG